MGSGKSTVAARLAERGAVVVDADAVAREVVAQGTKGLAELVARFGEAILTSEGALDRQALAERAFANEEATRDLNAITHPRIGARTAELMRAAADDAIVVHDIPLLVEGDLAAGYHLVLVVDADENTRVGRLRHSRGIDEADARARIAAQATTQQRRQAADVWLNNEGSQDLVTAEVDALWSERLVPFEANVRLRHCPPEGAPVVVPHDQDWSVQARRLVGRVHAAAGDRAIGVDHIGSTAVPGLDARDVLDLQLTVATLDDADAVTGALSDAGFVRCQGHRRDVPQGTDDRTECRQERLHESADPARPVNLSVRPMDGSAWRCALLLRDWLCANPTEAEQYAALKRGLAQQHATDTTSTPYTQAKNQWLTPALARAEAWAAQHGWAP